MSFSGIYVILFRFWIGHLPCTGGQITYHIMRVNAIHKVLQSSDIGAGKARGKIGARCSAAACDKSGASQCRRGRRSFAACLFRHCLEGAMPPPTQQVCAAHELARRPRSFPFRMMLSLVSASAFRNTGQDCVHTQHPSSRFSPRNCNNSCSENTGHLPTRKRGEGYNFSVKRPRQLSVTRPRQSIAPGQ